MHRDIKPHNLLYDIKTGKMHIIDWGLAEFYIPGKDYSTKVASRFYKAPELLLDNPYYDYTVDIWSLGCIFASVLFQVEIFFAGKNEKDQLLQIANVFGTDAIHKYVSSGNLKKAGKITKKIKKMDPKPLVKFRETWNEAYASDEAISLLSEMLVIDHTKRIMAKDALAHPYFKGMK